jgi:acyl-[acyl-carrier-protein]-phospholipid O-acyltransferase/long-chain-fatty-acid--[acyl-carrier-protein] ligase
VDTDQKMTRSFVWLNVAQFGGALNDNIFKLIVIFFLISLKGPESASLTVSIIGAIFVLPFLLFSPAAGVWADRYSKRHITVFIKVLEIAAMGLAMLAFAFRSEWLAYAVMFLMSTQSAIFSPSKYGMVPELVGKDRLSRANSLFVMFTYLAIILGSALAPTLDVWSGSNHVLAASVCGLIAVAGLLAALQIETTPAMGLRRRPAWWMVRDVRDALQAVKEDRPLVWTIWLAAYFLFLGGYAQLNLIPYGLEMLGISEQQSAYLFLLAALGIGFGAWWVGKLSGRRIQLFRSSWGMLGAAIACFGLAFAQGHLIWVCVWVALLGISAGFFIVPLEAFIQFESPDRQRGEVLAAKNFLSWVGVLLAALFLFVLAQLLGLDPAVGFGWFGVLTLLIWAWAGWCRPEFRLGGGD